MKYMLRLWRRSQTAWYKREREMSRTDDVQDWVETFNLNV